MIRRGGGTPKVVAGVVVFFGFVYFIYLYNDLSGQLKNTENSAARYRRDAESASAQLQVQMGHNGRLQKALQAEKLKFKASLDGKPAWPKLLSTLQLTFDMQHGSTITKYSDVTDWILLVICIGFYVLMESLNCL
ncbi:Golgi integral membrane protein 4 [Mactra antiquata]